MESRNIFGSFDRWRQELEVFSEEHDSEIPMYLEMNPAKMRAPSVPVHLMLNFRSMKTRKI